MALKTRQNNANTLNLAAAWSPATVPATTDQLYWNGVTGTNATVAMGGAINVGGTGGGILLGASQTTAVTIDNATAAALTLGTNGIDLSSSGANLTLGGTAATLVLNANQTWNEKAGLSTFINSVISGAFSINFASGGFWYLSSAGNSYSGGTTVGGGVVRIASNTAFGTNTVTMTGGQVSSTSTSSRSLTNALTLNGTMTLGDTTNTGALTFSGTTTISAPTTLYIYSFVNLSGTLGASASSWSKDGAADFVLTGTTSNYAGAFTAAAGSTRVGNAGSGTPNQLGSATSISISPGASFFFAGGNTHTQASNIVANGLLYSRNTAASPGVTLSGTVSGTGEIRLYTDSSENATSQTMTFANWPTTITAGYWINSNPSTAVTQTFRYTGSANVGSVTPISTPFYVYQNSGTGTPTVTGVIENASSTGATMALSGAITLSNTGASPSGTFQVNVGASAGLVTLSGAIDEASTGTLNFAKLGTGPATLTGANGFTGTVSVSAGTLNANSATALGAASSTAGISVTSGATLSLGAALNYSSPGRTTTISGTGVGGTTGALVHAFAGTANVGAISLSATSYIRGTASGTSTLSSSIANGGFTLAVGSQTSGSTFSLTGGISGLGGLQINGGSDNGTVALSTVNTYQGNTSLLAGTLLVGNATALGTVGTLIFGGGAIDASTTLTLANALTFTSNITFGGTAALTLSSNITLPGNRIITTNGSGGALTLSGIVSGATFKLTKAGTNTLTLTNANTYSGGTDIGAGTVQAGNTQALGTSGTVTLTASGATLQTLTTGGQNGKLTVAALTNSANGTIKIGG